MNSLQLIDLLDDDLRPPAEVIPFRLFLVCLVGVVLLLAAFTLLQDWQIERLEADRQGISTQLAAVKAAGERIEPTDYKALAVELEAQLDQRRAAVREQQLLLDTAGEVPDARAGFSGFLRELAEYDPRGLWLNSIVVELPESRVRLYGLTEDAELVPVFLENLASSHVYAGTRFDQFEVAAAEEGEREPLRFAVFAN